MLEATTWVVFNCQSCTKSDASKINSRSCRFYLDMARILHRFMWLLSINDCVHVYEAVWLCSNGYYLRMNSCILVIRVIDW